mgnify:CR=1 FL=1
MIDVIFALSAGDLSVGPSVFPEKVNYALYYGNDHKILLAILIHIFCCAN